MKIQWLILSLLLLAGCAASRAPENPTSHAEIGNGGHGVVIAGRVYLLDLVEAGLEQTEIQRRSALTFFWDPSRAAIHQRLVRVLDPKVFPCRPIAAKLGALGDVDPLLAATLLQAIELHTWSPVNQIFKKLSVPGEILKVNESDVLLIANRRGRTIYLSLPVLALMNPTNVTALVFHEVIYSLLPPQRRLLPTGEWVIKQNGTRAREITAALFGAVPWPKLMAEGLTEIIEEHELPRLASRTRMGVAADILTSHPVRLFHEGRATLPSGVVGIVGAGLVEVSAGKVRLPNDDMTNALHDPNIQAACQAWSTNANHAIDLKISFDQTRTGFPSYELRFSTYQDRGEVQQFLEHRPVENLSISFTEMLNRLAVLDRNMHGNLASSLVRYTFCGFHLGHAVAELTARARGRLNLPYLDSVDLTE